MAGTEFESGPDGTMPRIGWTDDVLGGDPRIEDRRIGVYHVYQRYVEGGQTAEEIATAYGISAAEVHAALAYAFSNLDEMRTIEARNREPRETAARLVPGESEPSG